MIVTDKGLLWNPIRLNEKQRRFPHTLIESLRRFDNLVIFIPNPPIRRNLCSDYFRRVLGIINGTLSGSAVTPRNFLPITLFLTLTACSSSAKGSTFPTIDSSPTRYTYKNFRKKKNKKKHLQFHGSSKYLTYLSPSALHELKIIGLQRPFYSGSTYLITTP